MTKWNITNQEDKAELFLSADAWELRLENMSLSKNEQYCSTHS